MRRLARSHLLTAAPRERLADVIGQVYGIQAQVMGAAELAVGEALVALGAAREPRRAPWPGCGGKFRRVRRARLSYERAEQLFKRYSGGKTLHQLRHSPSLALGSRT
jgi:hypothetical protein